LEGKVCPPLDVDPNPDHDRIIYNRLVGNGLLSTGNPILDELRGDLVWDGSGTDDCWRHNRFATSVPTRLPACRPIMTSQNTH
jgi:hypothetical protein